MNPQENNPEVQKGGYHSRGVPGEEANARKRMRVLKIGDSQRRINTSFPVKGGGGAQSTAAGRVKEAEEGFTVQPEGERAVYTLTRKDSKVLDIPVLRAGEDGKQESLPIFTTQEKALLYLQVARWDQDHEPGKLSPADLATWLDEARRDGIELAVIDPDRREHLEGKPQPVIVLEEMTDFSGNVLFREIRDLAQGTRPGT